MKTNDVGNDVMVAPLIGGVVTGQRTAVTLDEMLAEAHRNLVEKGEALRRATVRASQGHGSSDMAYSAWQQAKSVAVAIYAEVKAQRARLAMQDAA